jgi:hypothetical protein
MTHAIDLLQGVVPFFGEICKTAELNLLRPMLQGERLQWQLEGKQQPPSLHQFFELPSCEASITTKLPGHLRIEDVSNEVETLVVVEPANGALFRKKGKGI